jgi:L-threonate 2-dehydrogenase
MTKPLVGIIAQGKMGAGIGARLVKNGLEVWTVLDGRGPGSAKRTADAGMKAVSKDEIAKVDIFLSVLPPSEADTLAQSLSGIFKSAAKKPVYADLNAISPSTAEIVAKTIAATGAIFADGGIIGGPPDEKSTPAIYTSGPGAKAVGVLGQYGLDIHVMDAPVGAASAVKLSFAGITKGFSAMASMMLLAASRSGAGVYVEQELKRTWPQIWPHLQRSVPGMFDKAYRFSGEMREIADFVSQDAAAEKTYNSYAEFYDRIAADHSGPKTEIGALARALQK